MKCPNCSGELNFDINEQTVRCPYCGSVFNPANMANDVKYAGENKEQAAVPQQVVEQNNIAVQEDNIDMNNNYEGRSYTCSQCGAELLTFDDTAVTFCSYCGSQAMIESRLIKLNNPDYIIPFKKTKEECIKNYKRKIKMNFFAPSYMKSDIVVSKFRGIFMPYVVYKISIHGNCSNTGKKYVKRRGDYVYYDDYAVVSNVESTYEGFSYDLASNYYDKFSSAIPFDLNEKKDFNLSYLSGFYADKKDLAPSLYDSFALSVARRDASSKLSKEKPFRKYTFDKVMVPLSVEERKMAMFPVYFLSVLDKDKKHINYAVVNGQTGKVAADVPIDFKKYLLLTLILAVIIFFIINNNLVILPTNMLIISIVAAVVSLFISNKQINKMDMNRSKANDFGYSSRGKDTEMQISLSSLSLPGNVYNNKNHVVLYIFLIIFFTIYFVPYIIVTKDLKIVFTSFVPFILIFGSIYWMFTLPNKLRKTEHIKKVPLLEKIKKYLYKQLLSIIVGLVILLINPVNDIYYYGGCIFVFAMVVISFYDLVKERNEIISNQLPQLGKRGGDENE